MVKISYHHTYYNVEDGEFSLMKIVHDGQGDTSNRPSLIEYAIPGVIYHTIRGLSSILNNAVSSPASGGVRVTKR